MTSEFREVFIRDVYNDNAYDKITDMRLITIDRTEERVKNSPTHIAMTVPNNKKIIEEDFIGNLERCIEKSKIKQLESLILIPTDTFNKSDQIGYGETKELLNKKLGEKKIESAFITAKSDLKHPDNVLVKFILNQIEGKVRKGFNCFEIRRENLVDERLKEKFERDVVEKID